MTEHTWNVLGYFLLWILGVANGYVLCIQFPPKDSDENTEICPHGINWYECYYCGH